ncbi:hypothetical protein L2E82_08740 [Cichorium intybus]|uniref:Uncharacterized protein n=1 Tax=Cichorium intybus TaxID=13427 RepID=A0ACB9G801_CICIN|nr:hypothetical protein L2E82_08740 [Cichorium intybus]
MKMTINWNAWLNFRFTIDSNLEITMEDLLGDELYALFYEFELSTILEVLFTNRQQYESKLEMMRTIRCPKKKQKPIENSNNLEINPNGDVAQEVAGTNEEQEVIENAKNEDTTPDWNSKLLESAMSHLTYFGEIYLGIGDEVEESTVLEIVSRCRPFYTCRLEELRKMKEDASGSSNSSHGRNEEQESTENVENRAGNQNEDQDLIENGENREEQRANENVEENPVNMVERRREKVDDSVNWFAHLVDQAIERRKRERPRRRRR